MRGKLTRSSEDRVFGGVCGGLAAYLGVDPYSLRIACLLLGFATVIPYVVLWAWLPRESCPGESNVSPERHLRKIFSEWEPGERILWGYEGLLGGRWGAALAVTDRRIRQKTLGKGLEELRYDEVVCLQTNRLHNKFSLRRFRDSYEIVLYSKRIRRLELPCDRDSAARVLGIFRSLHAGTQENSADTRQTAAVDAVERLRRGIEREVRGHPRLVLRRSFHRALSERLQSRFVGNIRPGLNLFKIFFEPKGPILLYDDWILKLPCWEARIPREGVTLLRRTDIRFAFFSRHSETTFDSATGSFGTEEVRSSLHILTASGEYDFADVDCRRLSPHLALLNPQWQ